ncbi:unnamed protein product [Citrullus colocynthis]|uniref:Uncharacterized protein n=1 Tax=Citrullus colocynthis TaxID=252529 RepID=A0ABP0YJ98_9ROSI
MGINHYAVHHYDNKGSAYYSSIWNSFIEVASWLSQSEFFNGLTWPGLLGKTKYEFAETCAVKFVSTSQGKLLRLDGLMDLDLKSDSQEMIIFAQHHKVLDGLQAEHRAHRRGQTKAVNIYIFCAKDTLDDSNLQNLNKRYIPDSSL